MNGAMEGGGDINPATKRRRIISVPASCDDDVSKPLATERTPSSVTNIHDLPKELLIEILCRLPCAKSIHKCKTVSKTWDTVTSDSAFIGRFLWLLRKKLQLQRIDAWSPAHVNELCFHNILFERLSRYLFSSKEALYLLRVRATYNDLVLCYTMDIKQHCEYHICNPLTMKLVSLPRICPPLLPQMCYLEAVGFLCERYYMNGSVNAEYRSKVVRIVSPKNRNTTCRKLTIQVFSSETSKWKESLVSCPLGLCYSRIKSVFGFANHTGTLYWNLDKHELLGLGPFMMNKKSSSTNGDDSAAGYGFHVTKESSVLLRGKWSKLGRPSFRGDVLRSMLNRPWWPTPVQTILKNVATVTV